MRTWRRLRMPARSDIVLPRGITKIMAVAGPSGVGKTSLVRALIAIDRRFRYIQPYTTRALRVGETEKIHVSREDLAHLRHQGKLLMVNQLYGALYGTPREPLVV